MLISIVLFLFDCNDSVFINWWYNDGKISLERDCSFCLKVVSNLKFYSKFLPNSVKVTGDLGIIY